MSLTESPILDGTSEELFAVANAIAAVVGGSVAVEDLERRVLAYSSLPGQRIDELRRQGILNRRVPEEPEQLRQYREVLAAPGVVRLPTLAADELPRAAVAIRAGDLPLGTIWAIEGSGSLDPAGERALLDGAGLAALHMLRRRSAAELDLHAREDALRGALNGSWSPAEVRFRLGLPDRPRLALLGLAPLRVADREPPPAVRLGAAAARHWAAVHAEAAVATVGRTVYVLLPELEPEAVRRLAGQAVAALGHGLDTPLRAAFSRPAEDPGELPDLRAEVDDILRVTTADRDAPAVAGLTDTHARVLLSHFADELARRPRLRHPGIEAMVEHDRGQHTAYAASVTAWLDAVGNVAQAADRLAVHPNTLKYRLRRARELFGIDLDHPDDRLSCWLQLRAR
ncbi:helix-turn-helix domain-containing protein [Kitasatospora atroaurantiaca]|uniref:PucR-like helix-turn-helix protein n=1 Tax=Kitasatospora atroaurantiaca TaxID=285545 RepID=A0A561EPZ2_9ACTN|nr:helix-turn-helix domain-containing protein [Kitasatospora atroaurantiaca]TWE17686.1 PucR-like helix-turn-helix protein [Kitasatospora atroaurantiaca]